MKYFTRILTVLVLIMVAFAGWEASGRILTGTDDINIISLLVVGTLGFAAAGAVAISFVERKMKNEKDQ